MIAGEFFFFRKLLFLTLISSNSKVYFTIALKFSVKQINIITKKSGSAIWKTVNINGDFRVFLNASQGIFQKNTKTNKIKNKFFSWKLRTHCCWECYNLDMCQNTEKSINVWWSWSTWKFFLRLKTTWLIRPADFVNIKLDSVTDLKAK